jgi:hypothetical protein
MTPEELRLECLKLVQQTANASGILLASREIISRARAYADFVMGQDGNGSAVKTDGAPSPELAPEKGFRIAAPSAAQFEPGAFAEAVSAGRSRSQNNGKPSSPRRRQDS